MQRSFFYQKLTVSLAFILICSFTFCQSTEELRYDSVANRYQQWLSDTSLSALFTVEGFNMKGTRVTLQLNGRPLDALRISNTWNWLNAQLELTNSSIPDILMGALSEISEKPFLQCEILLSSIDDEVFSGRIYFIEDSLMAEMNLFYSRGFSGRLSVDLTSILPNPKGTIICKDSLQECRNRTFQILQSFLAGHHMSSVEITKEQLGENYEKYEISNIPKLITGKFYHEKLRLDIVYSLLNEDIIQISSEMAGWYASGYSSVGEFRDIRNSFYKEFILFYDKFDTFYSEEINK